MRTTITPERMARIRSVASRRQPDLTLVLSNIHDPHNVSAIYRSCDAFGVQKVHLHYTDTAFPALGKKSSGSAKKWVETVRHDNAADMMQTFKNEGYQVLATGFSDTAKSVLEFDFTCPTAVILGNEHDGVESELRELATDEIYIPMQGMIQSLNVSVAAAVTLFEAWRQRQVAGFYDQPRMHPQVLEEMIALWAQK